MTTATSGPFARARSVAGFCAVLAMLALSSPGVRLARAEAAAPPVSPLPAGPTCQANHPGELPAHIVYAGDLGRRVVELLPDRSDVVTLNPDGISTAVSVRPAPPFEIEVRGD
jgi:hypothetical protein